MQPLSPGSASHFAVTVISPPCSVRGHAQAAGTPLLGSSALGRLPCLRALLEKSAQPGWLSTHPAHVTPLTPLQFRHGLQPLCWRGPQRFMSTKTPKKGPNPLVLSAAQTPMGVGPFPGQESPSRTGTQGQEAPASGSTGCSGVLGVPRSTGSGQRSVVLGVFLQPWPAEAA